MKNETCPKDALFIVPWGGKLIKACLIHANSLCRLGEVIGSPLQVQQIITDENCQMPNDLEEYKKAEAATS